MRDGGEVVVQGFKVCENRKARTRRVRSHCVALSGHAETPDALHLG
jgi:hypothetical protein